MLETPFITGSDIVSNPGNAALGYSSGVVYNANPEIQNPFAVTQNALAHLTQEEKFNRQRSHQEAVKQQQDLADYLAQSGQSLFNMPGGENGKNMSFNAIPEDKEVLRSKADELRRMVINNPTRWKFDADRLEKEQKLQQLVAHAGIRSVAKANLEQQASQTNDPDERAEIISYLNEMKGQKLEDFISPQPHFPKQYADINDLIPADIRSGKNKESWKNYSVNTKDVNGNIIAQDMSGMNDNSIDFRAAAQPGTKPYTTALKLARSFYNSSTMNDPLKIVDMNKNIDQINTARGYTPGSVHYIPHIAEVMAGGKIVPNNLSPTDVAYSIMAEAHGGLQPNEELKKTSQETQKATAEINSEKANTANTIAKTEKIRADMEADKEKGDEHAAHAKGVTLPVVKMLQDYGSGGDLNALISRAAIPERAGLNQIVADNGIVPNNYTASKLGLSQDLIKISGVTDQSATTGKSGSNLVPPTYAYVLKAKDGDPNKALFIVGYQELVPQKDEKGNIVIDKTTKHPIMKSELRVKKLTPSEAIGNIVQYSDRSDDKTLDGALSYWDKLNGKVPQNSSIPTVAAPSAPSVPKPIPPSVSVSAQKVPIDGKNYYFDSKTGTAWDENGNVVPKKK